MIFSKLKKKSFKLITSGYRHKTYIENLKWILTEYIFHIVRDLDLWIMLQNIP